MSSKSSFVMVKSNLDNFAGPDLRSALPIHLSTDQNIAFVKSYSNVQVVSSITRFDGEHLSYALVCSNCNKLVITWPLGRLADLSPLGGSSASTLVAMLKLLYNPLCRVTGKIQLLS